VIETLARWIDWLYQWQERRRLRRFERDLDGWIAEMGIED